MTYTFVYNGNKRWHIIPYTLLFLPFIDAVQKLVGGMFAETTKACIVVISSQQFTFLLFLLLTLAFSDIIFFFPFYFACLCGYSLYMCLHVDMPGVSQNVVESPQKVGNLRQYKWFRSGFLSPRRHEFENHLFVSSLPILQDSKCISWNTCYFLMTTTNMYRDKLDRIYL